MPQHTAGGARLLAVFMFDVGFRGVQCFTLESPGGFPPRLQVRPWLVTCSVFRGVDHQDGAFACAMSGGADRPDEQFAQSTGPRLPTMIKSAFCVSSQQGDEGFNDSQDDQSQPERHENLFHRATTKAACTP